MYQQMAFCSHRWFWFYKYKTTEILKPIINQEQTINLLHQMKSAYHRKTSVLHGPEQYYRRELNFDIVLCAFHCETA